MNKRIALFLPVVVLAFVAILGFTHDVAAYKDCNGTSCVEFPPIGQGIDLCNDDSDCCTNENAGCASGETAVWLSPSSTCECQAGSPSGSTNPQSEAECRQYCSSLPGKEFESWDDSSKTCSCKDKSTNGNGTGSFNLGSPWGGGPGTVGEVLENVTNWVLGIAGALAVLFIIISGIRYITSAGNPQLQESAKKNLTSAIIGLVIVLIAFVIVNVIARVLTT